MIKTSANHPAEATKSIGKRAAAGGTGMLVAILLAAAGPAPNLPAPSGAASTLAPTDGTWTEAKFLYLKRPAAGEEWITKLVAQYGQKPSQYGGPGGLPLTYQIFEIVPGTRTIIAIGDGAQCETAPNGNAATLTGIQCPVNTITVYADGRVNARTIRPGCYLHVDSDMGAAGPNPRTNGTYMRYDPQTGAIQYTTVVNGRPQAGCQGSTHV